MFRIRMFDAQARPRTPGSAPVSGGRSVLDRLRARRRVRPLQISEVVRAVEEHLRAAALPSLESRYLPTFLAVRVSSADWQVLSPFEEHLQAAILDTYARLSEQPRLASLRGGPRLELSPSTELELGDEPELASDFARRVREASWRPGRRTGGGTSAGWETGTAGGLIEALVTSSSRRGTARQSMVTLCLAPELPLRLLDPGAGRDERLRLDEQGEIAGSPWPGGPPEELSAEALTGLDERTSGGTSGAGKVYRFGRPPAFELLWAPGCVLILGRRSGRAHWVPPGAPPNLSGRHLALRLDAGGTLSVVDLGSTNGVYVDGGRVPASELVALRLPACLDVGREGAVRIELSWLALPPAGADERRAGVAVGEVGGTLEELA